MEIENSSRILVGSAFGDNWYFFRINHVCTDQVCLPEHDMTLVSMTDIIANASIIGQACLFVLQQRTCQRAMVGRRICDWIGAMLALS